MSSEKLFLPIEKYREILEVTPVCTVDVLFFNKDRTKTLLFKRTNEPLKGIYFSIGGRLLKNERLEDCAVRQTLREAGIHIQKVRLVFGGTQEEFHPTSVFNGVSYHVVGFFYGCILGDEEIVLDSQHSDYRWFSVFDEEIHPLIKTKIESLLKKYEQGF
ncbi:MAG: NUDIX domain-containing protein [Patescibacteria group bacterium]|nr:NUDIX domain-containing protein [Patescibacteria group bacterium]